MSEPVMGVVVGHADLAEAFVRAVERISGVTGGLVAISNEGLGPADLCAAVGRATASGTAIVFVDLASGSCAAASRRVAGDSERVAVLAGVSLPVLLDFVFHREMPLADLVERLIECGRAAISAHHSAGAVGGPPDESRV